jgi:hypothetical protein
MLQKDWIDITTKEIQKIRLIIEIDGKNFIHTKNENNEYFLNYKLALLTTTTILMSYMSTFIAFTVF